MIVPAYLKKIPLEREFEAFAMPQEVNIQRDCLFADFLEPNEYFPERVKRHLQWTKEGVLVSTGTVRSLFDLIFSDETKCEGLVVVDINPRVKAYVDFIVLLLRISKTRDEFVRLSTYPKNDQVYQERVITVGAKIAESHLPQKIKAYYLQNFKPFASIYLAEKQSWRDSKSIYFSHCRFDLDEGYFRKVKNYADSGNIITTIGRINDLKFLGTRHISIIDTSNILNYSMINLEGNGDFKPRVIWTVLTETWNKYRSYIHESIDESEKNEITKFIGGMKEGSFNNWQVSYIFNNVIALHEDKNSAKETDASAGAIYSRKTLKRLREFIEKTDYDVTDLKKRKYAHDEFDRILPQKRNSHDRKSI